MIFTILPCAKIGYTGLGLLVQYSLVISWISNRLKLWGQQSKGTRQPMLLESIRLTCQRRHFSHRTAPACAYWYGQFILFNRKKNPRILGKGEITPFLNDLVTTRHLSATSQSQALNVIVFMYRHVLEQDPGWLGELDRQFDLRHRHAYQ